MAYDNSGAIFRNDRKEKPSHPDHTGQATIDGREFWISAWVKEKNGKRFFSLAFKPKDDGAAKRFGDDRQTQPDIDERDVPF